MSASAPLGRPSRNTGSVEADWTSATRMGEVVSVVISQAAATSFIHMQVLAATQVSQSMRNTGTDKGANGESEAAWFSAALSPNWAATDSSVPCARSARAARSAAALLCGGAPGLRSGASGEGGGATLRVLSWDGNGGMSAHCATVGADVVVPR
jgi:hypothetical protein